MKSRNGFVSNSSSTSYILAYNHDQRKICKCCNRSLDNDCYAIIGRHILLDGGSTKFDVSAKAYKIPGYEQIEVLEISDHNPDLVNELRNAGYHIESIDYVLFR